MKPRQDWAGTNLAFMLAPLLLEEISDGPPPTAMAPREMQYVESELSLNGTIHRQITYLWWPAPGLAKRQFSRETQGLRITLSTGGEPVIWEVLPDGCHARIIFVSQKLESLAAKQFGPSLPGRRFAVETSLATAPAVVVARVIDDGPAVMGPVVYIQNVSGKVATLLCRCMTPQVREIVATEDYELRPLATSAAAKVLRLGWPIGTNLTEYLRLPLDF